MEYIFSSIMQKKKWLVCALMCFLLAVCFPFMGYADDEDGAGNTTVEETTKESFKNQTAGYSGYSGDVHNEITIAKYVEPSYLQTGQKLQNYFNNSAKAIKWYEDDTSDVDFSTWSNIAVSGTPTYVSYDEDSGTIWMYSDAEEIYTQDLIYTFYNMSNLTDISALSHWIATNCSSMYFTFSGCSSLSDLTPLASWTGLTVGDFNNTFSGCSSITDASCLSSWDLPNNTGYWQTFNGVNISNDDLDKWPTWFLHTTTLINEGVEVYKSTKTFYVSLYLSDLPTVYKDGYAFTSWNTAEDGTGDTPTWNYNKQNALANHVYDRYFTLYAQYVPATETTLVSGGDINSRLGTLAGGSSANIKAIKRADTHPDFLAEGITYNVISAENNAPVYAWYDSDTGTIWLYPTVDKVYANTNMANLCKGMTSLTDISGFDFIDMSTVTTLSTAFYNCTSLTSLAGIENWDVSNVTTMDGMCQSCTALTDISALANWDVSNVTTFASVFYTCTTLTDLSPLSGWTLNNTASVNLSTAFSRMYALTDVSPLANWTITKADLGLMFFCDSLLKDASCLSVWDVSNSTNYTGAFSASGLTTVDTYPDWCVRTVTVISDGVEVYQARSLVGSSLKTTDFPTVYKDGCVFTGWNTAEDGTGDTLVFNYYNELTNHTGDQYLTVYAQFTPTTETNLLTGGEIRSQMSTLAGGLANITAIKLADERPDFDSEGIAYNNISASGEAPVYIWYEDGTVWLYPTVDTVYANANMTYLCCDMTSLTDISGYSILNTSKTTNTGATFSGCSSLTDLSPIVNWDMSNVTDARQMFKSCSSLTDASRISVWDMSKVSNFSDIFNGAGITDLSLYPTWYSGYVPAGCSALIAGNSIRTAEKSLAGNNLSNITAIKWADTCPDFTLDGITYSTISITNAIPVYIWYDSGTIWMYSTANTIYANADSSYLSCDMYNLADISAFSHFDMSRVTNFQWGFSSSHSITDLSPLSDWVFNQTSTVNMAGAFNDLPSLTDVSPLAGWPIAKMNFNNLFNGSTSLTDARCLSGWNVSKVTDFTNVFNGSGITDASMYPTWYSGYQASDSTTLITGGNIRNKMITLAGGIANITAIKTAEECPDFDGDGITYDTISNTNETPVYVWYEDGTVWIYTDAETIYANADSSNLCYNMTNLTDISALADWDVSKVTSFKYFIHICTSLADISPLSGWVFNQTAGVDLTGALAQMRSLTDLSPIANWKITRMNLTQTFDTCTALTDASCLSAWDVSAVTSTNNAFLGSGITDASLYPTWYSGYVAPASTASLDDDVDDDTAIIDANGGTVLNQSSIKVQTQTE
jgi:surface protein